MNHIIIEGFMGSGKSTIGKKLAKKLDIPFLELEKLITKKMNMSANEIFEKFGEAYYRAMESFELKELQEEKERSVITIGGGLPAMQQNWPMLEKLGCVVYLDVAPDVLVKRLEKGRTHIMLKGGNLEEKVHKLLAEREESYKKVANVTVSVTDVNRPADDVVAEIAEKIKSISL